MIEPHQKQHDYSWYTEPEHAARFDYDKLLKSKFLKSTRNVGGDLESALKVCESEVIKDFQWRLIRSAKRAEAMRREYAGREEELEDIVRRKVEEDIAVENLAAERENAN